MGTEVSDGVPNLNKIRTRYARAVLQIYNIAVGTNRLSPVDFPLPRFHAISAPSFFCGVRRVLMLHWSDCLKSGPLATSSHCGQHYKPRQWSRRKSFTSVPSYLRCNDIINMAWNHIIGRQHTNSIKWYLSLLSLFPPLSLSFCRIIWKSHGPFSARKIHLWLYTFAWMVEFQHN